MFPALAAAAGIQAAGSIGGALMNKSAADDAAAQQRQIGKFTARRSTIAGKKGAKAAKKASKQQVAGIEDQIATLNRGHGQAEGYLNQGLGYLEPYAEAGQAGMEAYADLLGVNGPEAQARAYEMYNTSPGFQEAVNYGIQQAEQSAASGGNLFSGGTLTELAARGQRMRLEDFNNWRNHLQGLGQTGVNVAGQQVGITNSLADYAYTNAQNVGGAQANIGATKAGGTLGAANARIGGYLSATNALAGGQQNASALGMYGQGQMAQGINNAAGTLGGYLQGQVGGGKLPWLQ